MDADWSVTGLDGRDDVRLVTVELRNPDPVDRRVRVDNRLDGPVLPPRRAGVPDPGWDRDGFTGVVPAGERRPLGYACPAPPSRPPVSVVDEGRATGGSADDDAEVAVRELADPRPPADAVPDASPGGGSGSDPERNARGDGPPTPVASWLATVERRIERGEGMTGASVAATVEGLGAVEDGGHDVATLDARLSTDATTLRTVAERASTLADRAEAVDIPVEALRRLA
ncbi:hypothetical protein [Haloplanus salilacus]|uniref:DUF7857 domain-containing protein n=1 Tax=Haloplanus salilacus TaxID=2949994 RepID=UPI0030CAFB27